MSALHDNAPADVRAHRDFDPEASSLHGEADPAVLAELQAIRGTIDNIDAALVHMLAERFRAKPRPAPAETVVPAALDQPADPQPAGGAGGCS